MPFIKICSQCGTLNPEAKLNCRSCGASIAAIDPVAAETLSAQARELGRVGLEGVELPPSEPLSRRGARQVALSNPTRTLQHVVISGVDVGFLDLMWLMVKLSIAAVPAMIIVAIFWLLIGSFLMGFFSAAFVPFQ
jgi:hypothetical protein